jgi:hypothetical protein
MEFGLYTFVENTPDVHGKLLAPEQRIAHLLE